MRYEEHASPVSWVEDGPTVENGGLSERLYRDDHHLEDAGNLAGPPTVFDVVAEVRKLAAENPDFTYQKSFLDYDGEFGPVGARVYGDQVPEDRRFYMETYGTCQYRPDERNPQGCIIGAALTRLGLLDPETFVQEGEGAYDVVKCYVMGEVESEDVRPSEAEALGWLASVQARQDAGDPWSEAVDPPSSEYA